MWKVIGLVRNKYTMLQEKLPIDVLLNETGYVPVVDKIVARPLSNVSVMKVLKPK